MVDAVLDKATYKSETMLSLMTLTTGVTPEIREHYEGLTTDFFAALHPEVLSVGNIVHQTWAAFQTAFNGVSREAPSLKFMRDKYFKRVFSAGQKPFDKERKPYSYAVQSLLSEAEFLRNVYSYTSSGLHAEGPAAGLNERFIRHGFFTGGKFADLLRLDDKIPPGASYKTLFKAVSAFICLAVVNDLEDVNIKWDTAMEPYLTFLSQLPDVNFTWEAPTA